MAHAPATEGHDVPGRAPLRVLVVHRGVLMEEAEPAELAQLVNGLLVARRRGRWAEVYVSDCDFLYRAVLHAGEVRYCRMSRLRTTGVHFDVAYVHMPIPVIHLATALRLRRKGTPVVLSPMGMLGDDYARSTWFAGRRTALARVKPSAVAVLRSVWRCVANRFICLSVSEVVSTRLPPVRSAVVPWPRPLTALARAALVESGSRAVCSTGPVAFVARFDVQRKGIDRLALWLRTCADVLPRPAVVLFAPAGGPEAHVLHDVVRDGLLEWDASTTGADLRDRLLACRAVMLLSRWEAQARALREAAVLGLPTISTATGGFGEVNAVLGVGVVVDGDDPADVQRAFEAVASMPRSQEPASSFFDPALIGEFLFDLLEDVADGRTWKDRNYYEVWSALRGSRARHAAS